MVNVYRFTAKWCSPCQGLSMILANENLNIKNTIDIDEHPDGKALLAKYNIRGIPAIVIDNDGDVTTISGGSLSNYHKDLLRGYLNP